MKHLLYKVWPILVLFGLWFMFSFPYFGKGLVPFPSTYQASFFPPWNARSGMAVKNNAMPDIITQIYPWKKLTIETWKSGHIPLWNPYSFAGTPHAGNYQTAVFSPFNLLFFVMPFVDAWSVMVLLQPLLAGLLMYLCLRGFDHSKPAALFGSIAFMFCGFIVTWMAYGTLGYAVLWLPLIFWGVHGYWRKPRFWYSAAIVFGAAISLTAGHFQMSLYVLGASAAYIVWRSLIHKQWGKGLVALLLLGAGIMIAAPQLLLAFHSYTNSMRSGSFVKGEIIPWVYLITFIAPDFFGNPVTRNDWFGHYAEWAGFIGVLPLLLSFYGILYSKITQKWFFVLLATLSLLFALPTPLNNLLYMARIPVVSTSAASRIIILVSFALAVLSGAGLDALIADWKNRRSRRLIGFAIGIASVFGLVWAVLLAGQPWPADKLAIAKRNFLMPTLIAVAAIGLVLIGAFRSVLLRFLLVAAIIGITSFDLFRFATKWMPFDPKSLVFPEDPVLTFLSKTVGSNRVFGNFGNEVASHWGISSLEGYDAVYQARYGEFISSALDGTVRSLNRSTVELDKNGLYTEDLLNLLGARYILHRISDGRNIWTYPFWKYPKYRQIYSDGAYEVWENPDAYPRAFLASSYLIGSIDTLLDTNTNRRQTLVLEEKPDREPAPGDGSAVIADYQPNSITVHTSSEVPKLLFLSDVFDPGWNATVDGQNTLIYRADYDFRAVSVPAGNHTVIFRYAPIEYKWGLVLSVLGIALLVLLRK